MNKNIQGHLFALTANILWGLMAPIGKSALVEFSALSVTTFRMVGAAACFWLLSLFCKREQVDHRDMLKIFFAALFAQCGFVLLVSHEVGAFAVPPSQYSGTYPAQRLGSH